MHREVVSAHVERLRRLPEHTLEEGMRINLTTPPVIEWLVEIAGPTLVVHGKGMSRCRSRWRSGWSIGSWGRNSC